MNKCVFLILSVLFLVSCKNKIDVQASLIPIKQKDIFTEKDILTTDKNCVKYYEWEGFPPLLAAYSDISNQIFLFDYKTEKVYSTIDIAPLGIQEIRDFQFANPNEIVVVEQMTTNYFVIDSNSTIINQFNLNEYDPNIEYAKFACFNGGANGPSMLIFDENLLTTAIPFDNNVKYVPYQKHVIFKNYKFDSIEKNIYDLRSSDYMSDWRGHNALYYTNFNSKIVVSEYEKDYIIEFNESRQIKTNLPKSNFLIPIENRDSNKQADPLYVVNYRLKTNGYVSIHYDNFRNLFYRVVELPAIPYEYESIYFSWSDKKEFSIMIFDENFNLLGEQKFPAEKYNYHSMIPTREGLLISTNNSFNPNNFSYKLQYEVFDLKLDTIVVN